MRKDMKKLLCETYRINSGGKNGDVMKMRREKLVLYEDDEGHIDIQDAAYAGRVTSIRQRSWESGGEAKKFFGENLAPLRRWIASNVGRPWNKIWSEISEVCPKGNPVDSHIYEHIWGYIEKDVEEVDGKLRRKSSGYDNYSSIYQDWLIHPRTGLLVRTPDYIKPRWKLKRKRVIPDSWFKSDDDLYVRRDTDGCWFQISFCYREFVENSDIYRELKERKFNSCVEQGLPVPRSKSGYKLRTLSRKEKQVLGL